MMTENTLSYRAPEPGEYIFVPVTAERDQKRKNTHVGMFLF